MPDSEENKSEVTTLVVPNPKGTGVREILKGADGKFVKKPRRMITTLEITRMGRKLMNMPTGEKVGKRDINRFQKLFLTLYEIATNENSKTDAKFAMASVQAAKELMLRVGGKPSSSDEEIEAFKQSGIKVILLSTPELMHPQLVEGETKKEKLKPSFIDAEIVHTNEPEK